MQALQFGAVRVYLGEKSGKYPDGNQVIVQGADARVAFDTPQVARHIGPELDDVDAIILGHVHEDHMVALGRLRRATVQVHEGDLAAAQSWAGLGRHYGYPDAVLAQMKPMIERDFDYAPRPDATGYTDGALWELGGGVRVRAHHLPGHTAGHSALVVESEVRKVIVSVALPARDSDGDILLIKDLADETDSSIVALLRDPTAKGTFLG